jgi:hypothetical protein
MFGMHVMNPVNGFPSFGGRYDVINDVNAPDHEHIILQLDLS